MAIRGTLTPAISPSLVAHTPVSNRVYQNAIIFGKCEYLQNFPMLLSFTLSKCVDIFLSNMKTVKRMGTVSLNLTCTVHHTWCFNGSMRCLYRFYLLDPKVICSHLDTGHWAVLDHLIQTGKSSKVIPQDTRHPEVGQSLSYLVYRIFVGFLRKGFMNPWVVIHEALSPAAVQILWISTKLLNGLYYTILLRKQNHIIKQAACSLCVIFILSFHSTFH